MNAVQLLDHVGKLGVRIRAEGGRLRIDAPRDTITPELRDLLARHKGEILEILEEGAPPILPVSRDEPLCVSFSQKRLWFVNSLIPDDFGYNTSRALRLRGELDREALRRSLDALVERHESLRTSFREEREGPVQVVAPAGAAPMRVHDLSGIAETERETELRRRLEAEYRTPFDLAVGPLFRTVLFRLDEQEHVLLVLLHHIISDAWSLGVLQRDLEELYRAQLDGRHPRLPELPVQYADFAAWQREWLSGEVLERQIEYWKRRLAGWSVLEFPTDRPRPRLQRFRGARECLSLPATLADGLEKIGRDSGATLFMTMLAAFEILLHRYTGQDDIVVGSPIAGRGRAEVEGLIGFFVNTLVLRTDLSGDPSFRELLDRVKEVALGAYRNQDLPFEKLVEELVPERDLSRNPVFQVTFAVQNAPATEARLEGLAVSRVEFEQGTSVVDLSASVWTGADGLRVDLIYCTDLFDAAMIRRMGGHFRTLLQGIVADPDAPISELPIVTSEERDRLLLQWNDTRSEYPSETSAHRLFEVQAERTPGAPAVLFEDVRLTYAELDERANRLARHLRALGVGSQSLVGICVDRSPEMVVAILGVLKSGGAYVPLDPSYPEDRLAFMLEDSRVSVLLTQRRFDAELPDHAARTVWLDSEWGRISEHGGDRLDVAFAPDDLAYVIYTSGSTGRPKGVQIEHRGLCNLATAQIEAFGVRPDSRVLQFAPFSFDASVSEVFMALARGAALVLGRRQDLMPGPELIELLQRQRVTTVTFSPTVLRALPDAELPDLETIVSAGEPCTADLVRRWGKGRRFLNAYGPTETTVCATIGVCDPDDDRPPSIGLPMANMRVDVLDPHLRLVPVGVVGEMFVSGPGVARGYLGNPELTAERFVENPLDPYATNRAYRTGDLARRREDGSLEYVGRADHQVKVRGFRIEPEEIEATLREHPSVRSCLVVACDDGPEGLRLVAYVVPEIPSAEDRTAAELVSELRGHARGMLPEYMVPSAFVVLDAFPVTPSGKVDRRALPDPGGERLVGETYVAPRSDVEARIVEIWRDVLQVDEVGVHDNFFDLGGHSLLLWQVRTRLAESTGREVPVIDLFRYPTVATLAGHLSADVATGTPLAETARQRARARRELAGETGAVAIVGLACRFPDAFDPEQFWSNLRAGVESVRFFSHEELRASGVEDDLLRDPAFVGAKACLAEADLFDASFFDYSPREASLIDPQQRLFLECAWEALESAGYDPERYDGRIGVYAGVSLSSYANNLRSHPDLMRMVGGFNVTVGNDKDFLPTRVAYKLNLRGPAINVQTACSTSLVAVHQACQSLLTDECTMALAGGASVTVPLKSGYLHQEGGILSRDGHCRTFDAEASGTLAGHGVGVVLLKRLRDALADGDPIHAVILGSAINNDGSLKVGFTAPGVEGQAEVIATAQAMAGVDPDTIGYIEAHGTGTALGDPIEVSALTQVFRERTDRKRFCAIGSLKSNLGHMDAAAGVGGLIKTVLALSHGVIPPSLHFRKPNPELGIEESPFYVAAECEDWQTGGGPRRAGVSSFGIGGTNAHVVLEEAPSVERPVRPRCAQLLTLSARTESALEAATANLARHLADHPELDLADVAWTLQVGRRGFTHRRALVCGDVAGAAELLQAVPQRMPTASRKAGDRPVIFMFTGQGSQYPNMGRRLYESEPLYRKTVDRCCEVLATELGFDLREILFPEDDRSDEAAERIARTEITQPTLFVTEYALARLWMHWGIRPRAMIGHSIGEYVAACVAGEFSLDDALRLVAARGPLMGSLPGGSMLAVPLAEEEVRPGLPEALSIAAINAPGRCVVSGPDEAIDAFAAVLESDGTPASRLRTSHAFHSSMMDPILDPFTAEVGRTPRSSPSIPYVSNVTGTWKSEDEVADAAYWARHLRSCVRFADGLASLLSAEPEAILLEVGPGDTLASLTRRHPDRTASHGVVASMRRPKKDEPDREFLLDALGRLWVEGVEPDWAAIHGGDRPNRVSLPTYPFERKRYWIEKRDAATSPAPRDGRGKKADLADWFYIPSWRRSLDSGPLPAGDRATEGRNLLVFAGDPQLDGRIVDRLVSAGHGVTVVRAGASFDDGEDGFTIDPRSPDEYRRLLEALSSAGRAPDSIVHLWCAGGGDRRARGEDARRSIDLGFHSLLHLAQALGDVEPSRPVRIDVVTAGVHEVTGGETIHPERAAVLGPCRVIPLEYANLTCRNVDLSAEGDAGGTEERAAQVARELLSDPIDPVVAFRNGRRWVEGFESVRLESPGDDRPARLRRGGVYLITGGFGGIALQLAGYLAAATGAKLVLASRTALPDRAMWEAYIAAHGEEDVTSGRIRAVRDLEEAGAEVMVGVADVTELEAMRSLVDSARERFGPIHGVIHTAGVAGGGMIQIKNLEDSERVLAPKVDGARVLERLFESAGLDFMVLCSSLNSVKGFPGQADYCAANAYLDAFARRFAADTGTFTVAIDWNAWREVGMAANADLPTARKARRLEGLARVGISNAEGVEVLRRILSRGAGPQVLVSSEDLETVLAAEPGSHRLDGEAETTEPAVAAESGVAPLGAYPRPELQNAYAEPRTDTERVLAEIWQRLLGIDRVGVHDSFFELGGDSLVGIELIARAREVGLALEPKAVFEHETVAELAEALDTRAREVTGTGPDSGSAVAPDFVSVDRNSDLPLSSSQQRLWFLDQLGSGSAYNLPYAYRLSGRLNPDDLRAAIQSLVERHEALRTCFPIVDGTPVQHVCERLEVEMPLVELRDVGGADPNAEIDPLIQSEYDHHFDLAQGPLLRAKLVRLSDHEHVLIVNMHHIVSDGWSMDVFCRDLNALYRAHRDGASPNLPQLPVQYPDYAVWQRQWLETEALQEQLAFWRSRLAGLEVLDMPTDRPRPATQTFAGAAHRFSLPRELSDSLIALSRERNVTPFMTMLAAFQTLLHRYAGQDDIVVGSPIANRARPEVEGLIGFFVNALVLRSDFSDNPTFVELLQSVRETALAAYGNQDLPFERLVDELDPERDLSHNPLFQVVFVYNAPRSRLDLVGVDVAPLPTRVTNTRNDMEFFVSELPDRFACNVVYNTDLFDASTVERMAGHFETLLEGVVAHPESRVSDLEILQEDERRRLLVDWNRTEADYPSESCIHELIEARVEQAPDATAVVFEDRRLTYAELNAAANRIAHTLRSIGIGPDTRVALCVERCPEMIVGLLAILKSGGAYVPIDPGYPEERLAFLFGDCGASVMLTQEHLLAGLPWFDGRVLCFDRDRAEIASAPADNPARVTTPDDLAYVIYTSGSTGTPKGALLPHRGLCNLSDAQTRAFGVDRGSRVLQFSSLSFDASTFEVVMALPKGATLYLGSAESLRPGPELLEFIRRNEISTVTLTPTALSAVPVAELPALRTITVAGEACSAELVARWAPGRKFFNLYGPTETTIWATMAQLTGDGEPPHIGRPIQNFRLYILDRNLRPVPVGVPGELCIGGVGLARGYHDRAELTAERFVGNPFRPGERLYRTGDLTRYRPDGNVEFLGRIDHQVKLRGFRIELGEIESVLEEDPRVRESVAMLREDGPGERRLVAYVVPTAAAEATEDADTPAEWQEDHVAHWQTLYDQSYANAVTPEQRTFQIAGWSSSYTDEAIPAAEMREWVDRTVETILATGARRVLELGCGTGLLLFRIAPHCEEYLGTDFSRSAVDYVEANLGELGADAARVALERRRADDLDEIEPGRFDTVILNSVVQYFPSADYLVRVLEGALARLRSGGRVFVGDVRSFPLMRLFHASVQLRQAGGDMTTESLRRRIYQQINQDQELLVDPRLFFELRRRLPRIGRIEIRPKPGSYDNELSRFRYDAVLHVEGDGEETPVPEWLHWSHEGLTLDAVRDRLRDPGCDRLALAAVPNRRVVRDVSALELLDDPDGPDGVEELRRRIDAALDGSTAVGPEDLHALCDELPFEAFVSQACGRADGSFDVVFRRRDGRSSDAPPPAFPSPPQHDGPWSSHTNSPLRGRRLQTLVPRLREHAGRKLPEYMVPSAFVVLDELPVTPNGKVDLRALPALDSSRPALAESYAAPRTPVEETLARVWSRVLSVERVGIHDNFFELGGDSILSIQVVAAAREAGIDVSARNLFEHQTVGGLAGVARTSSSPGVDQGSVTGTVHPGPIQHWFFEQDLVDPHHFNQALILELRQRPADGHVSRVIERLIEHHDALRIRARRDEHGWRQEIAAPRGEVPLEIFDTSCLATAALPSFIEERAAGIQAGLDLARGPLIRAGLFRGDDETPDRLFIAAHHLVVDGVSWRILLDDIARGLEQLRNGQELRLPPKTTSVKDWARRLGEYARTAEVAAQAEYWIRPEDGVQPLPVDLDGRDCNTVDNARNVMVSLDRDRTRALIQDVPGAYNTEINDVLLTALASTFAGWTGRDRLLVDLESHGRHEVIEDTDLSRTVGWFTSLYPVLLSADGGPDPGATLRSIKEQLRTIPGRGLAYGLARYLSDDADLRERLARRPRAEVAFNYLGQFDQVLGEDATLRQSDLPIGPHRSARGWRTHLLEVNSNILGGRLRMNWTYSTAVHREDTVRALADRYLETLNELVEHCTSVETGGYTPSDFAEFDWSQTDIDEILQEGNSKG